MSPRGKPRAARTGAACTALPPLLALLAAPAVLLAPRAVRADPPPVSAVRATPAVDGRIDEPAWQRAPWTDAFLQRAPSPGARATHRTRARLSYDAQALYVAVECESDARPAARVSRRDQLPLGDWVRVLVDARGEGSSAFSFSVNPAGVQADAIAQGDSDYDEAWDAVWSAETHVTDAGWTAEFRIPWRVLRFDAASPRIRVQIDRLDAARGETDGLVPIPTDCTRFCARFAELRGLEGVAPGGMFLIQPYLVNRFRLLRDPSTGDSSPPLLLNVGTDIKFGLSSDLVFDATVNPDFGQVEVDPAVINLSTYETFYPERRPFFLEGSDIARTPMLLLHTRRIGATPALPDPLHPDGVLEWQYPSASIIGAGKVSGRVGNVSVFLLDALTAPAYALETYADPQGRTAGERRQVEGLHNWLAARVRYHLSPGSTAGGMFTHLARLDPHRPDDAVGALDVDLRAPDGVHRMRAQVAASSASNPDAPERTHTGQALFAEVGRLEDPAWIWTANVSAYSRDFDPNGMGYLSRANAINASFDTAWRTTRPMGAMQRLSVNPWGWYSVNLDGLPIARGSGLEFIFTSTSQWHVGAGGLLDLDRFDDRETRGGIPYHLRESAAGWSWIDSDSRRSLRGGLSASFRTNNGGAQTRLGGYLTWNVSPSVTLSYSATLRTYRNIPRWVANETDAAARTHSVFGLQNGETVDNTLRASLAFSRRATLDLYSQLLFGALRYDSYAELVDPYTFAPYGYAGAGYDRVAFTVNAVGRYEYLPGSFVTLVFLHQQGLVAAEGDGYYGRGLGLLGGAAPETQLMAKLTYLFQ